jgi:hypothetical protein
VVVVGQVVAQQEAMVDMKVDKFLRLIVPTVKVEDAWRLLFVR